MQSSKGVIKPYRLKLLISAAVLLLIVITAFVIIFFEQNSPDPASAAVIRNAAAMQLGKDPNELTDEDFWAVSKLDLSGKEVYDISLLRKFANLEELNLGNIPLPKPKIPKWMIILGKLHFNPTKIYTKRYKDKYFIDLRPLEKLPKFKRIHIHNTAFKDLKPLEKIENLQMVHIMIGQLEEYESIKIKNVNYENISESAFLYNIMISSYSEPAIIRDTERLIINEVEIALK